MSEFSYTLPFEKERFLEFLIFEGKRLNYELPWSVLEQSKLWLEDLGYSYYVYGLGQKRWNAAGIFVNLSVPFKYIDAVDNKNNEQKIIKLCNRLVPPDVGYDFKGVKFLPDYSERIEELERESPGDILHELLPDNTESILLLTHDIKRQLEDNAVLALDRLHTFSIRFFKVLCDKHGLTYAPEESLHVLYATYKRFLDRNGLLEASMTANILRVTQNLWNEFNTVRNNQTFAHDNPVLNKLESNFLCNQMLQLLKFIHEFEKSREEVLPW